MPLTSKGKKLKSIFVKEYGKKRGISIFYSYENKHPLASLVKKKKGGL
jgi:hypothetical protein